MPNDTIARNIADVKRRMAQTALEGGRSPDQVRLVAVGKTQTPDAVRSAIKAGAAIIGENYVQESREKFDALVDLQAQWHFIGHLQRNKAKYVVRIFDLIHSVDSEKLAAELDKEAQKIGKVQKILVQVNISGERTKSGISEAQAISLVKSISKRPHLRIKGLMTMPPYFNQPEKARPHFAALRQLKERIQIQNLPQVEMAELSMGMTGDFEVAIAEGATLVRVGTAIFGERL